MINFSELNETQKSALTEKYRFIGVSNDHWHECTISSITEALELIGFYDVKVYFSGFWFQGAGACFVGKYEYQKGALKKIKNEWPEWGELHAFAEQLQLLQRPQFYGVSFELSRSGIYYHENSVNMGMAYNHHHDADMDAEDSGLFLTECRDFMQHIYESLEKEYNHLTSDSVVAEYLQDNFLDFEESGSDTATR